MRESDLSLFGRTQHYCILFASTKPVQKQNADIMRWEGKVQKDWSLPALVSIQLQVQGGARILSLLLQHLAKGTSWEVGQGGAGVGNEKCI